MTPFAQDFAPRFAATASELQIPRLRYARDLQFLSHRSLSRGVFNLIRPASSEIIFQSELNVARPF